MGAASWSLPLHIRYPRLASFAARVTPRQGCHFSTIHGIIHHLTLFYNVGGRYKGLVPVQLTIYYAKPDRYLIDKVDEKAHRDRKSRSAVILSILEAYFEGNKKLGQILVDMGKLSAQELDRALELQAQEGNKRRIGEILVQEMLVQQKDVERALAVQNQD